MKIILNAKQNQNKQDFLKGKKKKKTYLETSLGIETC